jgi:excisionase family DNA binding protein
MLYEPLLTPAEVGELLGRIPTKTVLQYARDGRLACVRIGKHTRFDRFEIAEFLNAQQRG